VAAFALVESPELLIETVLSFHGDGDDGWGLTLTTSFQDEIDTTSVTVIPGCFDHQSSGMDVTGFGDWAFALGMARGALGGHEAEVSHECRG